MQLYGSDDNPVPKGSTVGAITSVGGTRLRYAVWRATVRRSLGTVVLVQGRGEAIERYYETVNTLRERGFAVAAFDWRGQGGSERMLRNPRKGHVDSFTEYDADLETFMREVALPDCPPPYFALAHSMGAHICLRAARAGTVQFSRMVLSGPFVAFGTTRTPTPLACRISALMTAIGLGELRAPGEAGEVLTAIPFEDNKLTSDAGRFARNLAIYTDHPQVAIDGPTYGWLYAACTAVRKAAEPDFASAIRVPTLIICGELDRVISLRAAEALAADLRGGGHLAIAGGRHELLMERDAVREQFWAAFDAFVPGTV